MGRSCHTRAIFIPSPGHLELSGPTGLGDTGPVEGLTAIGVKGRGKDALWVRQRAEAELGQQMTS